MAAVPELSTDGGPPNALHGAVNIHIIGTEPPPAACALATAGADPLQWEHTWHEDIGGPGSREAATSLPATEPWQPHRSEPNQETGDAALAEAAFWSGGQMLSPDATLPKERLQELVAGDAAAWNAFDLTLRRIEQIYKRYQRGLVLPPEVRKVFLERVPTVKSFGRPLNRRVHADLTGVATYVPTADEAEHVFCQMLAENDVPVLKAALPGMLDCLNAGLTRAGKPPLGSWDKISLAHFALVLRKLKLAQLFRTPDMAGTARGVLHALDYTAMDVLWDRVAWPIPDHHVRTFTFLDRTQASCPGEEIPVRWIHMAGLDPLMLLRLAGLHRWQLCGGAYPLGFRV